MTPVDDSHRKVCDAVRTLAEGGLLASSHDVSEGGLAVAIAECAVAGAIGVTAELAGERRLDELLFGEGPGRFVISYAKEHAQAVRDGCKGVPFAIVGRTGGEHIAIRAAGHELSVPVTDATRVYQTGLDCAHE